MWLVVGDKRGWGRGRGARVDILAVGQNFGNVEGNFALGAAGPFTLNDCSQTILLLYAHGMSLIIQILVEISPGTSLHNLTLLANLGTQKRVQQTYHTY